MLKSDIQDLLDSGATIPTPERTETVDTATSATDYLGISKTIVPVANGEVIAIDQVDDPVFSQKMMGDGFAVIPEDTTIYAPIDGAISSIFPSKHALGIKTEEGIEVLIHMGLDTVEMKDSAFTILVTEGQKITAGESIAIADLEKIKAAGKQTTMIVVFTNGEKVNAFHLDKVGKQEPGTTIGRLDI